MAYNMGGRRFRPVGSGKKRTAPQYGPVGTGCPFVEEAVARLYREQNEEHFWSLMNALNYALELQTKVLVPLDAAVDPQSGDAPWAHLPIPEERAEGLPPWLLHTRKERNYLPLFTSVKNAEAEKASATRPMVERSLRSAMEYALETDGIDGVVLDPWTSSATLDVSLLSGLLRSERGSDNPGAQELEAGHAAAGDSGHNIHLAGVAGGLQRLTDQHLQGVQTEILINAPAVDGDGAGAVGEQMDAGHRGLPATSAIQIGLLGLIHSSLPP